MNIFYDLFWLTKGLQGLSFRKKALGPAGPAQKYCSEKGEQLVANWKYLAILATHRGCNDKLYIKQRLFWSVSLKVFDWGQQMIP